MEKYNPFESSFTALKVRYVDYDSSIMNANFIQPGEPVNVFINLEAVFSNLCMTQDLEQKLLITRNYEQMLAAGILNLAAHYKRFFVESRLDTRVYLYYTNFSSENYPQRKYNENFRSYYSCKYTQNPKFAMLTDSLIDRVLPLVKTCCEFIPGVYYIQANDMEGSVIPYLINELDKSVESPRKNFIIGNDLYDTQYEFISGFLYHYIKRGYGTYLITCSMSKIISEIAKIPQKDCGELIGVYNNHPAYLTLLSCIGNKKRNIEKVGGIGIKTLEGLLEEGYGINKITKDTTSPRMIQEIFEDKIKDRYLNNYYCTSIPNIYDELTQSSIMDVRSQIIDRFDNQGLLEINEKIFSRCPLMLEALCS